MKWYSTKKYKPSYEGYYIVRYIAPYISRGDHIAIDLISWDGKCWLDDNNHEVDDITHFAIPDPVEIEE